MRLATSRVFPHLARATIADARRCVEPEREQNMQTMPRLVKNICSNVFGQGVLLILGFVSVRYIFKDLGEDALGIIYFTATMNGLLCAALEMGICTTSVREIATHSHSEPEYIHDFIRTSSSFYWGAYVIVGLTVFFAAPYLMSQWIHLKSMDVATAIYLFRVLGIASLVAFPQAFYTSLFRGLQRMELNNGIDVASTALQQLGTVLILSHGGKLMQVAHWFALCYGLRIAAYLVTAAVLFSPISLIPGFRFSVIKRNWEFSSRMMFTYVITTIQTQADKIIMSRLLPISGLGFYGFVYGGIAKIAALAGSISQAAFPHFSKLSTARDAAGLRSEYHRLQDLLCFGVVPLFAGIPFIFLPLLPHVFDSDTARMLILPTNLLCLGFFMNSTQYIPHVLALATGNPGIAARANLYGLFVALPSTFLMIRFLGLTGAGLAWVFAQCFGYFYGLPIICSQCIKMPPTQWYAHIIKIFILTILTYGIAWSIGHFLAITSIFSWVLAYAAGSVAYVSGAYLMIGDELRATLKGHLLLLWATPPRVA